MRNVPVVATLALAAAGCVDPDLRRGDEALAHGRYVEAIGFYEQARARLPEDPSPTRGINGAHRAHAAALLAEGRCAEAREHLEVAETLGPPVLVDHQELARCLDDTKAPAEARAAQLTRLLGLGDRRASLLRALAALEFELGREPDAVGHLQLLEQRSALTVDERRRLVDALLRLDRAQDAWPHIDEVVRADPFDAPLRLKRAELLEAGGRAREAGEAYRALAADFPRNPLVHLRLAEFLRRQGDEAAALAALAEADRLRGAAPPPERKFRPLQPSRR